MITFQEFCERAYEQYRKNQAHGSHGRAVDVWASPDMVSYLQELFLEDYRNRYGIEIPLKLTHRVVTHFGMAISEFHGLGPLNCSVCLVRFEIPIPLSFLGIPDYNQATVLNLKTGETIFVSDKDYISPLFRPVPSMKPASSLPAQNGQKAP